MNPQDWNAPFARAVTMALSGATGDPTRPDDPFVLMLNAWWEPLEFTIPDSLRDLSWQIEVDTFDPGTAARAIDTSAPVTVNGRSLILLHSRHR
jgi:glycogen operon protein